MQIKMRIVVSDVNDSKDGSGYFVTGIDAEQGGMIKFNAPGIRPKECVPGATMNIDSKVKPGIGKYGLYLKLQEG